MCIDVDACRTRNAKQKTNSETERKRRSHRGKRISTMTIDHEDEFTLRALARAFAACFARRMALGLTPMPAHAKRTWSMDDRIRLAMRRRLAS